MRLRIILSFALVVVVSVAAVVIVARQEAASEVRAFMFRGGMAGVEDLTASLESYYQNYGSWTGVESILSTPGHGRGSGMMPGMGGMMNQRIILADHDGYVIIDSDGSLEGDRLSLPERGQAVDLRVDGRRVGYLLVEGGVQFGSGDERYLVNRLTQSAITAGLIGGAVALLLALVLAYRILRPIQSLTKAASRLAEGDLNQRVEVSGDGELAALANTFNQMADSLQKAQESRRAMTADVAHELRNPLAVQRANLEAMIDGVYPLSPENLQPVLDQNTFLTRLVEDLRTLTLADTGELKLQKEPADMIRLVESLLAQFKPQAASKGISFEVDHAALPADEAIVQLDPGRVEQIIMNLMSNALRYTPPGGKIWVTLGAVENAVLLRIRDSGEGIPVQALPHVFERFYRADKSRSRQEGGTGLGLAIAAKLAEAHGGSLDAENHPQGGAVFTLRLPF